MTTRNKLQAEDALASYTRRHKRKTIAGALGNNAGVVEHPTRDGWVYVRLHGDSNQVILAYCAASVPLVNDLVVSLERVERKAAAFYQVLGIAENIIYVDNDFAGGTAAHASQHQRRDRAAGGFDPLDVYTRALVSLRARAQTVPDMTLYVERGFYDITGVELWAGGNSPAFTDPGPPGIQRYDLLYLGSDDALHILTGTPVVLNPAYPAVPISAVPIAYVLMAGGITSITEDRIDDARVISSASSPHNILGIMHSDTDAHVTGVDYNPTEGDIIYAYATGWGYLSIGAENKFLTVDNLGGGSYSPSWKMGFDDIVTVAGEVVVYEGDVTWALL